MAIKLIKFGPTPSLSLDAIASVFKLKSLYVGGTIAGITATRYQTLFDEAGAAYQVTAGKTFYGLYLVYAMSSAGTFGRFGYGDTAVTNSAAGPTNTINSTDLIQGATANVLVTLPLPLIIPATKYPFYLAPAANNSSFSLIVGFEE